MKAKNKVEFIRAVQKLINDFAQNQSADFYEIYKDINEKLEEITACLGQKDQTCSITYKKIEEVSNWVFNNTSFSFSFRTTPYDVLSSSLKEFKSRYSEDDLVKFDSIADRVSTLENEDYPSLEEYHAEDARAERASKPNPKRQRV